MNENKQILKQMSDIEKTNDKVKVFSDEFKNKKEIISKFLDDVSAKGLIPNKQVESELRKDFEKYVKDNDEVNKALDNYYSEYKRLMKEQSEEIDKLMKDFDLDAIKLKILDYKEKYEELGNTKKAKECENLLNEILNSVSLNNIKDAVKLIKNPSKVRELYKDNYIKESEAFIKRLASNKTYMFLKPIFYLENVTELLGSEDDAKLFLYHFYKYFQGTKNINKNAVFINEFTKNLIRSKSDAFLFKDELKESIESIVKELRTI